MNLGDQANRRCGMKGLAAMLAAMCGRRCEHSSLLKLERREGRPAHSSSKHYLQRGDRPSYGMKGWPRTRDAAGGREHGYYASQARVRQDVYGQLLNSYILLFASPHVRVPNE